MRGAGSSDVEITDLEWRRTSRTASFPASQPFVFLNLSHGGLQMNVRSRALAFAGAAAVGVVAAGAFAAPALAAGSTDLSLTLNDTTLAATTSGKVGDVTVTNKGAETATGVTITFDLSGLDTDLVELPEPADDACDTEGTKIVCGVVDVKPGANLDLPFELLRKAGSGDAGKLTATVSHSAADPVSGNDSATATVTVSDSSGPDLTVEAPDVPITEEGIGTVAPGGQADLYYRVSNYGDEPVQGLKLTIQLPEHVTFVEKEDDCEYTADNRTATCTYATFGLIPADDDTDENDKVFSAGDFVNLIKVADDAPAPGVLSGGVVTAEGIAVVEQPELALRKTTALPEGVEGAKAKDVDEGDNSDEYSVHVAKAGGGGGGGELPVTGVQAGLIGGIGLAVVAGGGAMLLVSRRRRVVLAVPDDEKPTA
jgi:hypothetical protein